MQNKIKIKMTLDLSNELKKIEQMIEMFKRTKANGGFLKAQEAVVTALSKKAEQLRKAINE